MPRKDSSRLLNRLIAAGLCIAAALLLFGGYEFWKRQPPLAAHSVVQTQILQVGNGVVLVEQPGGPAIEGGMCLMWIPIGTATPVYDQNWRPVEFSQLEAGQWVKAYVSNSVYDGPDLPGLDRSCQIYSRCYKMIVWL